MKILKSESRRSSLWEGHPFEKILLLCLFLFCIFGSQAFACEENSGSIYLSIMSKDTNIGIRQVQVTIISGLEQFKTVTFTSTSVNSGQSGIAIFSFNAPPALAESHTLRLHLKLPNGSEDTVDFPLTISSNRITDIDIHTYNLEPGKYLSFDNPNTSYTY